METEISSIRREYLLQQLDENQVNENPVIQFEKWLEEAISAKVKEPTAMCLSTVGKNLKPSARIVLLKNTSDAGFSFFTNYESRKAGQIEENPNAALLFFWPELERQVRIEGRIEKVSEKESDEYFNSRPVGSRLGAWASPQSRAIENRAELEKYLNLTNEFFGGKDPVRPTFWGGYRLIPEMFEFWQGRENRLHDRISFTLENGGWKIRRLAP